MMNALAVRAVPRSLGLVGARAMSSSRGSVAKAAASAAAAAPSLPTKSVLPVGTVIKGLSYLKDVPDPVAKEISEYPAWLWTIADPPQKKFLGSERRTKKYLKFRRKEDIKLSNFMKSQ